jgi:arginase
MLSDLGWRVEDLPDLNFDEIARSSTPSVMEHAAAASTTTLMGNAKNAEWIGPGTWALAQLVETKLRQGRFPLILGGDHSIGIGSLAGILQVRPDTGIIWIDAHADLHVPATSESGNMHGMPVGMNMDGVAAPHTVIPGFEWLAHNMPHRLSPQSIVYVGLRDVDVAERAAIRRLGVKAFTMHEIDRYGIGQTMEMALDHLLHADPNRPLHLSYDIDAIDPILAPATGTTVRGGLTFREAHYVAEAVALTGNLASAEMVELNPNLSDGKGAQDTVDLGLQIVTSLMGKGIL